MGLIEKTDISVNVGSLTLKSPMIIVSGVFGYGEEFQHLSDFNPEDAGAVVLKGVSLEPWKGNPPPRIVETAGGMINSIGLQNIGVNRLIREKLPKWETIDTSVVLNVVGHSIDEYVQVSKIAGREARVDALELNLSCPNISEGGIAFGTCPETVREITSKAREVAPDKPLWVKLTPNVEEIGPIAMAAAQGGADAVTLINTVRGMVIDIKTRKPILSRNIGGMSGPAIKPVAVLKVAEVCRAFTENKIALPIVGMGGVLNGSDVLELIIAGAHAVGIGTTLFYDPLSVSRINQEIREFLVSQFEQTNNKEDLLLRSYSNSLSWN